MSTNFRKLVLILIMAYCTSPAPARDVLELKSRYTGDGWFEYTLRTLEDPFFTEIRFSSVGPYVTNYVTNTFPAGWLGYSNGRLAHDGVTAQPRINEIKYSVNSSSRHFRKEPYGFKTIVGLKFIDKTFYPGGLGGYINLACLAPCAVEEADGSPEEMVYRVELIPDIAIDELVMTNKEVYGLTFSWDRECTAELQGSFDMNQWRTIAWIHGQPPQTTWTTNVSLNGLGKFFRLSFVAFRGPLLTPGVPEQSLPAKISETEDGMFKVSFATNPGESYTVEEQEWPNTVLFTKCIKATSAFSAVALEKPVSAKPVFFKVRAGVDKSLNTGLTAREKPRFR